MGDRVLQRGTNQPAVGQAGRPRDVHIQSGWNICMNNEVLKPVNVQMPVLVPWHDRACCPITHEEPHETQ
jgi:hypothetical protein